MGRKISPDDPLPDEDIKPKKASSSSSSKKDDDGPKEVDLFEKYEKEIVKKRHNCTDIICLILFIIFCLAQLILSILIYIQPGDPRNLLYPHDSNGNLCSGSTPNLFYFNIIECASATALVSGCTTPTICVSSCPSTTYYYQIQSHRNYMLTNLCIYSSVYSFYSGNIPASVSLSDYQTLMSNRFGFNFINLNRKQMCAPKNIIVCSDKVINGVQKAEKCVLNSIVIFRFRSFFLLFLTEKIFSKKSSSKFSTRIIY